MNLKRGDTFTNQWDHTWRLLDVYRNVVRAEAVVEGKATGLTATIKRSELEGWERVSGDCPVHAAQLAEVGEGLLDGFLAMCEAGQRVIDNERSSDE